MVSDGELIIIRTVFPNLLVPCRTTLKSEKVEGNIPAETVYPAAIKLFANL
jgi:hypothetical protein